MKKSILLILIAGLALMSAACGKPAQDAAAEATPTPEPEKAVEAFGVIEANNIRNISLDVGAEVETVNVKEGQPVKKDDILLTLNMKDYMEKIKTRQHDLSVILLEARKLDKENTNPDMAKLENDLAFANEQFRKASEELEIHKKLYESGAVSQQEYNTYVKVLEDKTKAAEDIKFEMDSMLRSNDLELAIQKEKAAAIQSEIRQMKEKIDSSNISGNDIVCDVNNGIVYELGYKAGDIVDSDVKLLSVLDLDTLVVNAEVAEEFIKDVKLGAEVEIIPVADKDRVYNGKVTSISRKAIEQNGETIIPVEISIDNTDSFLLPNFNVDVKIFT
ncbi:MAG TPA: efflux RND transporter periplasmic adaptor subunit, partial [Clostridia bacterium]|nr:efflux RND transporter periplasmic adaptor subunit [Clostridia bacterium]